MEKKEKRLESSGCHPSNRMCLLSRAGGRLTGSAALS